MMRPRGRFVRERLNKQTRRFMPCSDIVLEVDRGLASRKIDQHVLSPEDARMLAIELLAAAERAEGRRVDL